MRMNRPSLSPVVAEAPDLEPPAPPRQPLLPLLGRALLWILLLPVLPGRRRPSCWGQVFWPIIYGLLLLPLLLPLVVAALVYLGTHLPLASGGSPAGHPGLDGLPVQLATSDGRTVEAWLAPILDPQLILARPELLRQYRRPAVVLVPDVAGGPGQLTALARQLHEAGVVVLLLRAGGGGAASASTFGLRESKDVAAALELLRDRRDVDVRRIAVVGRGTGANAAMLAASADLELAAVVLQRPATTGQHEIQTRIVPPGPWLDWLRRPCKWGLEMAYGVDADDLDRLRHRSLLASSRALLLDEPVAGDEVLDFLHQRLQVALTATGE
jgi:fermentation-respiration switch protein FrsA (DUF1100 family)